MAICCLLFSSDEATAEPIRQVLSGLGVEGEYCSEAAEAVEKVTHKSLQIVVIDWDQQPEAGLLLRTARERKAADRPLTIAIVSDDASIPKALQAGANSILRKPLQGNQVKDTLTTARDLLRAKQESAAAMAQAAGASGIASATSPASAARKEETQLRARDFPEASPGGPKAQFVPRSNAPEFVSHFEATGSAKHADSNSATATEENVGRPSADSSSPDRPKGLEWYLKTRAGVTTSMAESEQASASSSTPDLIGFDQMTAPSPPSAPPMPVDLAVAGFAPESKPKEKRIQEIKKQDTKAKKEPLGEDEGKKEAELFAYIDGEKGDSPKISHPKSRLGKGAITAALVLAGLAILAAPQAPWRSKMRGAWARGQQAMHGWLNPLPVTPVQAPVAHENFGRAGDEYKLPVEENIPDATTDPSQIQVVPVVDPTSKKPNSDAGSPEQPVAPPDGTGTAASAQKQTSGVAVSERPSPSTAEAPQPADGRIASVSSAPTPAVAAPHPETTAAPPTTFSVPSLPVQPPAVKNRPAPEASSPGNVPSSLRSQIASMTPDASGNKPPEAAMDSIEPVVITEATERAQLIEQPALDYPSNAKGQHGTVILQVLIGRDGTVQDVKFLQGSLAFARSAIDGVKQWKFKPYTMNGRAVSVQTLLTITFKPTS